MYQFGEKSKEKLETCHPDLQKILNELIKVCDISVIEGHRSQETQEKYYKEGKSQLDGVVKKSKHQSWPSMAVDVMPWYKGFNPFGDRNGDKLFYYMAGQFMAIADRLYREGEISHKVRWGGNWDGDMDFFGDSSFFDLPHFELV